MSDEQQRGGTNLATSVRVYLEIEDEEQVHAVAERIAELLIELGFNAGDRLDAVVACTADAPDVEAWAEGMEPFVAAMKGAAFILLPQEKEAADDRP